MDRPSLASFPKSAFQPISLSGRPLTLTEVRAKGTLTGLVLDLTIKQFYRNDLNDNLEIVYAFPLPDGAELLAATITIGDKTLTSTVKEKKAAESEYEWRIFTGDFGLLTEKVRDGLFTVSLGNVLPQEEVTVAFRIGQILAYNGDAVRLTLPTVIAPWSGDPVQDGGFQVPEAPTVDILAVYPFSLELELIGEVSKAKVSSPSHPIAVNPSPRGQTVSLSAPAFLDRDVVINLTDLPSRSYALTMSLEETVVLAGFTPTMTEATEPVAIKVLVDLSGPMAGENLQLAIKALLTLFKLANAREDYLTLAVFGGDQVEPLVQKMTPMTPYNLNLFRALTRSLKSDRAVGDPGMALWMALHDPEPAPNLNRPPAIFIITASDLWDSDTVAPITLAANAANQRIFALGLGAAPQIPLLSDLSQKTLGATECIVSSAEIKPTMDRLWRKLKTPLATAVKVDWGAKPAWETPIDSALYDGLTVTVAAGFKKPLKAPPTLAFKLGDATEKTAATSLTPSDNPNLTRLATALRLRTLTDNKLATKLALKSQLLTSQTSLILVHERAEKATSLPVLQVAPQMMTAYYAGFGASERMMSSSFLDETMDFSLSELAISDSTSRLKSPTRRSAVREIISPVIRKCFSIEKSVKESSIDADRDPSPRALAPDLRAIVTLAESFRERLELIPRLNRLKTAEDFHNFQELTVQEERMGLWGETIEALSRALGAPRDAALGLLLNWLAHKFPSLLVLKPEVKLIIDSFTNSLAPKTRAKFTQILKDLKLQP
ncbi:MAG: hypothetical protein LBS60_03455 [Deltaproteobacteria bacterium]|jgi:Ca-activated chloride channel family protein|nr:hypothetical protein [Deltaproteobacteria bacterium]